MTFLHGYAQVQLQAQQAAYRQQQEKQRLAVEAAQREAAAGDRSDVGQDAFIVGACEAAAAAKDVLAAADMRAPADACADAAAEQALPVWHSLTGVSPVH